MDEHLQQREEAWVGDAVLALFAREWILSHPQLERQLDRQSLFTRLTCNQFLSGLGEPTAVEAAIARRYREEGLQATFAWLEAEIIPRFEKQLHRRHKGGRKVGPK